MTKNIKGLLQALQQSINEAILESHDVAAAVAALKRTGKCPVFTIDISMQDPAEPVDLTPVGAHETTPESVDGSTDVAHESGQQAKFHSIGSKSAGTSGMGSTASEELVLSDWDVEFLTTLGIRDPSWSGSRP